MCNCHQSPILLQRGVHATVKVTALHRWAGGGMVWRCSSTSTKCTMPPRPCPHSRRRRCRRRHLMSSKCPSPSIRSWRVCWILQSPVSVLASQCCNSLCWDAVLVLHYTVVSQSWCYSVVIQCWCHGVVIYFCVTVGVTVLVSTCCHKCHHSARVIADVRSGCVVAFP